MCMCVRLHLHFKALPLFMRIPLELNILYIQEDLPSPCWLQTLLLSTQAILFTGSEFSLNPEQEWESLYTWPFELEYRRHITLVPMS